MIHSIDSLNLPPQTQVARKAPSPRPRPRPWPAALPSSSSASSCPAAAPPPSHLRLTLTRQAQAQAQVQYGHRQAQAGNLERTHWAPAGTSLNSSTALSSCSPIRIPTPPSISLSLPLVSSSAPNKEGLSWLGVHPAIISRTPSSDTRRSSSHAHRPPVSSSRLHTLPCLLKRRLRLLPTFPSWELPFFLVRLNLLYYSSKFPTFWPLPPPSYKVVPPLLLITTWTPPIFFHPPTCARNSTNFTFLQPSTSTSFASPSPKRTRCRTLD